MSQYSNITPDEARKVLESLNDRDLIIAACIAHVLVQQRGFYIANTGRPRLFAVYRGTADRLGHLHILPNYNAAWYPVPIQPVQFDLPLTPQLNQE